MSDDVNPTTEDTPVEESTITAEVQPDTGDDAVLDRLIGDEDVSEEHDDTPSPEPVDEEQGTPDDLEAIVGVLRRDNVPQAVIDATDIDTLREWSDKASSVRVTLTHSAAGSRIWRHD